MISPMSHRSVGQKQHNNSWNLDQMEISPMGSVKRTLIEFSEQSPKSSWKKQHSSGLCLITSFSIRLPHHTPAEFSEFPLMRIKGRTLGSLCVSGLAKAETECLEDWRGEPSYINTVSSQLSPAEVKGVRMFFLALQ